MPSMLREAHLSSPFCWLLLQLSKVLVQTPNAGHRTGTNASDSRLHKGNTILGSADLLVRGGSAFLVHTLGSWLAKRFTHLGPANHETSRLSN